jgi:hypothetical protein
MTADLQYGAHPLLRRLHRPLPLAEHLHERRLHQARPPRPGQLLLRSRLALAAALAALALAAALAALALALALASAIPSSRRRCCHGLTLQLRHAFLQLLQSLDTQASLTSIQTGSPVSLLADQQQQTGHTPRVLGRRRD